MASVDYAVKYGAGALTFALPDAVDATVIEPRAVPGVADPAAAVRQALGDALARGTLARPGTTAIAISDATRPVPNDTLLPPLNLLNCTEKALGKKDIYHRWHRQPPRRDAG